MNRILLSAGLITMTLSAHAGNILGIKTSYTDDKKVDQKIDGIIDDAQSHISGNQSGLPLLKTSATTQTNAKDIWWKADATKALLPGTPQRVSLEDLYLRAIQYSTQIRVFSDVPLIRETAIQEAQGAFDVRGFLDSAYEHTNDPVGTLLETGFADGRFIQNEFRNEAGLRERLPTGADVTLSQQFGFVDNNSTFLVPNPQGTSRLKLSIAQPLLRGAGLAYNNAIIDIARIDTKAAGYEQVRQAESHLLEICRSYWTLYFARVSFIRKQRYFDQAKKITGELTARQDVDTIQGQIARAQSAVAFRESDLLRAQMEIANAQDRLRTLVNSPDLAAMDAPELIPSDAIFTKKYPVNYQQAARRAILQRPEIQQAILQIRASAVREKMAKNEVLPQLNLLLEGYVAGLDSDRNFAGAWGNQFSEGGPGALVGVSIEWPFANNAARARLLRRQLEMRQQVDQLKTTIDTVLLEVKTSVREVETAWADYSAKLRSVQAASTDLDQFTARRDIDTQSAAASPDASASSASATSGRTQSSYLDQWLDSQTRLEFAEEEFARVATVYQVALVNLERSEGNLLQFEDITIVRTKDEDNLPLLELQKGRPEGASNSLSK